MEAAIEKGDHARIAAGLDQLEEAIGPVLEATLRLPDGGPRVMSSVPERHAAG